MDFDEGTVQSISVLTQGKGWGIGMSSKDTAKSSSHVEAVHVRNANMSGHAMYGPLLQSFQPEASIALHDKRHYVSPDITAAAGGACLCWRIGLQCPSQKVLL